LGEVLRAARVGERGTGPQDVDLSRADDDGERGVVTGRCGTRSSRQIDTVHEATVPIEPCVELVGLRRRLMGVTCEQARERISARLDEVPVAGAGGDRDAELAAHLAGCAACRDFDAQAHALRRRTRLLPAPQMSDLTERVMSAVQNDAVIRRHRWWQWQGTRVALVAVAAVQLALTVPVLLLGHDHEAPVHVAHEVGAFAGAISLGLLLAAARPRLAAGMVPVVGAVAALLLLTAAGDLALGRTTLADEAPHLLDLAGFLLLWRLAKLAGGPDGEVGQWAEPSGVDGNEPAAAPTTGHRTAPVAAELPRQASGQ
jgi:predicted anti-sigma-YlaC factor YlaD